LVIITPTLSPPDIGWVQISLSLSFDRVGLVLIGALEHDDDEAPPEFYDSVGEIVRQLGVSILSLNHCGLVAEWLLTKLLCYVVW
jgi:hypothetical protein